MPLGGWSQSLGSLACQSPSAILGTLIGITWNVTGAMGAPQGVDDYFNTHLPAVTHSQCRPFWLLENLHQASPPEPFGMGIWALWSPVICI